MSLCPYGGGGDGDGVVTMFLLICTLCHFPVLLVILKSHNSFMQVIAVDSLCLPVVLCGGW